MAKTRDECIRDMVRSIDPARARELWGTDKVEELTDAEISKGIEYQKIIKRGAKSGKIIADYRMGNLQRYVQAYQQTHGHSEKNRRRAVENILVRSLSDDADRVSVEANAQAITALYQGRIAEAAEALKPGRLGWQKQRALMDDLADELHNRGSSGSATAKGFAEEIGAVMEELRLRFNRAGGQIRKLSDWAMPHTHDAGKIAKAGEDAYVEQTVGLLNRNRMTNPRGRPLDTEELKQALRASYQSIVGEELVEGEGKFIAGRHQAHRELHFRDGASYREYSEQFGHDNYYKTITDHIERLSREVALMETMGMNPQKTFDTLTAGMDRGFLTDHESIFKNLMGLNRPDKSLVMSINSTVRPALSAAQLGSAILSSFSDIGTASVAAAFNGLNWTRMLSRLSELGGEEARVFAAQLGGSIDYALDSVGMSARFDDFAGGSWSQQLADTVFRASGLNAFTNLMRRAHFMEFAYQLGANKSKALVEIEPRFQGMLRSYGITDAEWEVIRKTPTRQRNNQQYMDIPSMRDEGLQVKMMGIIHQERDLAVLMPDTRTKALLNQGMEQGTAKGEGIRAFTQYKSYSVMMVMNNLFRYLASKRVTGVGGRVQYAGSLLVATTLLGGLSVQLKEIAKGRDPRNVRDPRFLQAAMLQGGGLGILGDFAFSDSNRYGQPALVAAAGPTGGLVWDMYKAGKGIATGEPEKAANMLRYVPGQSLWYGRLIYERAAIDNFKRLTDPDFDRNVRRSVKRRKTEHGQEYYSKPGTGLREVRAPNLGAMVKKPKQTYDDYVPGAGKGKRLSSGDYVPRM